MEPFLFVLLFLVTIGLLIWGFFRKSAIPGLVGSILLLLMGYIAFEEGFDVRTQTIVHRDDLNNITSFEEVVDKNQTISAINSAPVGYFSLMAISLGLIAMFLVALNMVGAHVR